MIRMAERHLNLLTEPTWQIRFENRPSFFRGKYSINNLILLNYD